MLSHHLYKELRLNYSLLQDLIMAQALSHRSTQDYQLALEYQVIRLLLISLMENRTQMILLTRRFVIKSLLFIMTLRQPQHSIYSSLLIICPFAQLIL